MVRALVSAVALVVVEPAPHLVPAVLTSTADWLQNYDFRLTSESKKGTSGILRASKVHA